MLSPGLRVGMQTAKTNYVIMCNGYRINDIKLSFIHVIAACLFSCQTTPCVDVSFTSASSCLRFVCNFHCQKAETHEFYNLCKSGQLFLAICFGKNQIAVSFSCICPVITDNVFRHNIVQVVCRCTRLSPCGSTATLRML